MYSLVDSTYHYIRNGDGTEELYDYWVDPAEAADKAGSVGVAEVMEDFRVTLQALLRDLPPIPEGPVVHPVAPIQGG